jgi:hypothetical protein
MFVRPSPLRWSRLALLKVAHDGERGHQHHLLVRVTGLLSLAWAGVDHCFLNKIVFHIMNYYRHLFCFNYKNKNYKLPDI